LAGDITVKVLRGEPVDAHALTAIANCARRGYAALGLLQRDPAHNAKLINSTTAAPSDADARFLQEIREALAAESSASPAPNEDDPSP
jgi:hypothetical protein